MTSQKASVQESEPTPLHGDFANSYWNHKIEERARGLHGPIRAEIIS